MAAESYTPLPDVSRLDIGVLRTLREAIDERIAALEAEKREAGFKAIEEIASDHGFTKADVVAHFGGKRRQRSRSPKNPARYSNPAKPTQTWTGVGRRPQWVDAHLEAGGTLEELAT